MPPEEWLDLSEAAELLRIHPSTLRRWADSGKIDHRRTPGGRRQFDRYAIENIRNGMRQITPQNTMDQIETITRDFAHQHATELSTNQQGWLSRLNEEQKMIFRYGGQRLLGIMMQYISRKDNAESFLEAAERIARDYGIIFYKVGLSITELAGAFLHFRRSILESVQAPANLGGTHDQDGQRVVLRTSDFFDSLLIAAIESHANVSRLNESGYATSTGSSTGED